MEIFIVILFFIMLFFSLIPLFHLIRVTIYVFLDIDIVILLKKKYKCFLRWINSNNEMREFIKEQEDKKNHLKKECKMNIEALKFEYDVVYSIINKEIEKLVNSNYQISELYLMQLHKYYNKHLNIRFFEKNSVEFFNCVMYALSSEPVFVDIKKKYSISILSINSKLEENVIKSLKHYYQDIYYDDILVTNKNKEKLENKVLFDLDIYEGKVFIWASTVINIILNM